MRARKREREREGEICIRILRARKDGGKQAQARTRACRRMEPEVIFLLSFHPEIISGKEDSKKERNF